MPEHREIEELKWLSGAHMAPSAHNTQPWRFRILDDGRIRVEWSRERQLTIADPDNRDLYLAMGAAIEAARLKAGAKGQLLAFLPAQENEPFIGHLVEDKDQIPLTEFELKLAESLYARQTARLPHVSTPLDESLKKLLCTEAEAKGCKLHIVQERSDVQKLAKLSRVATADQFANAAVHEELCRWLRLNKSAPEYKRDGLTADCLNLDGFVLELSKILMKPDVMRILSALQIHHVLAMDTEVLVARSQSVVLLTTPTKLRAQLVDAGRLLIRLWLCATASGAFSHPVSALLDCKTTFWPTAEVFGVGENCSPVEYPVAIYRLGAVSSSSNIPRAPRLPISELLLD